MKGHHPSSRKHYCHQAPSTQVKLHQGKIITKAIKAQLGIYFTITYNLALLNKSWVKTEELIDEYNIPKSWAATITNKLAKREGKAKKAIFILRS